MNPIITGSMALRRYFPFFRNYYDSDIDLWILEGEAYEKTSFYQDFQHISGEIYRKIESDSILSIDGLILPSPSHLLTIKLSHMSWDISWYKHYSDAVFMQRLGIEIDYDLFRLLKNFFKKKYGDKPSLSLKKDKQSFFDDSVNYIIDHDALHDAVAGEGSEPIYKRLLSDKNEVMLDREKFRSLSFEKKILLFQEEITTIAIERWLIPSNGEATYRISSAFFLSLKKVVISLTKGWATDFILFNLYKFEPKTDLFYNAKKVYDIIKFIETKPESDDTDSCALSIMSEFLRRDSEIFGVQFGFDDRKNKSWSLEFLADYIYNKTTLLDNQIRIHNNYGIIKYDHGFVGKYDKFVIDNFPETYPEIIFRIDDKFYKLTGLIKSGNLNDKYLNINIKSVTPKEKIVNIYI
jgi:hypothetical protein